jgi:histone H3/H4
MNITKGVPDMDDPRIYRKYADDCKRLAKTMSPADRKIMLEIAEAWLVCAKEAERKTSAKED